MLANHSGPAPGRASPLAAYLPESDRVLVLDVNPAFKPWLVAAERLYAAMDTLDNETGQKRGLLLIQ